MFGLPHYKGHIDKNFAHLDLAGRQLPYRSRSGSSEMCVPILGIFNDN